jgi:hypothetical protein
MDPVQIEGGSLAKLQLPLVFLIKKYELSYHDFDFFPFSPSFLF